MMSESFGWKGDGERWARFLSNPELVGQERGFEGNRCEVIVGGATLCLKDRLKDPMVPLLLPRMSRQTMSSWLSGAGEGLTPSLVVVTVRGFDRCPRGKVGTTSFRKLC